MCSLRNTNTENRANETETSKQNTTGMLIYTFIIIIHISMPQKKIGEMGPWRGPFFTLGREI